ncbi:MAG TPA: hypothetical protein VHE35_20105, partial [Kofleriaceae bacterium]|nr:hypothetical protein [Kofleriaceae bacterium]
ACVGAADGYGTCEGECGQPGGPCCGDSCNSGTCYLGTCPTESSDPCYVDGDPHTVVVIDAMCNSQVVTFLTKDEAEAEACRDQLVLQPGEEACAVDTKPETTTVCEDGFGPVYFDHCSDQQLATCEANKCANCEYTETSGSCPHGP